MLRAVDIDAHHAALNHSPNLLRRAAGPLAGRRAQRCADHQDLPNSFASLSVCGSGRGRSCRCSEPAERWTAGRPPSLKLGLSTSVTSVPSCPGPGRQPRSQSSSQARGSLGDQAWNSLHPALRTDLVRVLALRAAGNVDLDLTLLSHGSSG